MTEQLMNLAYATALVLVALGYLALRSRRNRGIEQARLLPELPQLPIPTDGPGHAVFYVVTTIAGQPLARIIRFGLSNRGRAVLRSDEAGVYIERLGETPLTIARHDLMAVETTSSTIGKAVERDGLLVLRWRQRSELFETFLRVVNQQDRERILANIGGGARSRGIFTKSTEAEASE